MSSGSHHYLCRWRWLCWLCYREVCLLSASRKGKPPPQGEGLLPLPMSPSFFCLFCSTSLISLPQFDHIFVWGGVESCTHPVTYRGKQEVAVRLLPQSLLYLTDSYMVFQWSWEILSWLDQLAGKSLGSTCLCSHISGVIGMCHHALPSTLVTGVWSQVWWLRGEHFTDWVFSSSLSYTIHWSSTESMPLFLQGWEKESVIQHLEMIELDQLKRPSSTPTVCESQCLFLAKRLVETHITL